MSVKNRFLNVLFWSVVSAAFIGPGTITTASKSGALFGTNLLWALLFSTLACLLLQEASSRISIASGKNLGQAIQVQFAKSRFKVLILALITGAVVFGAAAYEMGNLLGALSGLQLVFNVPSYVIVLSIGVVAATILSIPSLKIISRIMGFLVIIMGFGFLATAILVAPQFSSILKGAFIPKIPDNPQAGILVLGLIGTTIVPYNLFLGSGITSGKQPIKEMRLGLAVAVLLGGLFSMAVLIVGTSVTGGFSFENLTHALEQKMGITGKYLLGFGLFAAGFTSAVTAPLASAITLKSLFGDDKPEKWKTNSTNFRLGWVIVLLVGLGFALANFKPIPAIIIAQALNGFLLPFISIFLFMVINNQQLMGLKQTNNNILNILTALVILVTLIIGLLNAAKAFYSIFIPGSLPGNNLILLITALSTIITIGVWIGIKKQNV